MGAIARFTISATGYNRIYWVQRHAGDRETGLYYYRARYLGTEGRFLTEDPLQFRAGINFYSYVLNNPINANDPTGLLSIWKHESITNKAAHDFGLSPSASVNLAGNVRARDSIDDSVFNSSPEIQNLHAMRGVKDDVIQGKDEARFLIQENLSRFVNTGNLSQGIHLIQDVATPGHRDQVFEGPFADPFGSIAHGIADTFPSQETEDLAYANTITVLDAVQTGKDVSIYWETGSLYSYSSNSGGIDLPNKGQVYEK